ncbi:MAG: hypothetical protein KQI62_00730 [Deltaproteobacteria bacterium]|nr:hypothetical protein [Deltaproteobacteria bacterium]
MDEVNLLPDHLVDVIMDAASAGFNLVEREGFRYQHGARFSLVGIDGHRGDIITLKAAKTLAAWQGRDAVETQDVETAAELSLPHRMRRQPFSEMGSAPTAQNTAF